jgi:SAM-dependent methyltransferase
VTVVPFLPDGGVVLVVEGDQLLLPSGPVLPGEDPLVDTALRVPLETAGFRRQGTHVLATLDRGRHVVLWVDGGRYAGARPHRHDAPWWSGSPTEAAALLRDRGDAASACLVENAAEARATLSDAEWFADSQRLLDAAYLAGTTPESGSGFSGSAEDWRAERSVICDPIDRDGTFLDVGCANGHLMASVALWSAERGLHVEPYGVDISGPLVELARQRLPQWADRLWVGNALTWVPPDRRRFDFVHTLLDCVPDRLRAQMIDHLLDVTVAAGGSLIVSHYVRSEPEHAAEAILRRLGYEVAGTTRRPERPGRAPGEPSAWITPVMSRPSPLPTPPGPRRASTG